MQISSYFASVGIDFDINSLKRAQTYMKRIEKTLDGFKKRTEKNTNINLNVRINRGAMLKAINTDLMRIAKSIVVPISRFQVNQQGLNRAIAKATSTSRGAVRIGAVLSQSSLAQMRQQVRHSLSGIVISPTVNARVRNRTPGNGGQGGNGGPGGGGRVRSPNHNPMLIGGAAGSLMRFGPYALPFVAGAYGLNALSNTAQTYESQSNMLTGVVGNAARPGKTGGDYEKYLSDLADRLGMKQKDLTPGFSQMLAGSMGTKFEPHMLEGFKNLTEYGAVMNLGPEQMKLSIRAFTQMIGKQQIMAEELKGQAAESMPSVVRLMAEAVTGGDIKQLFDMMEKGKLDPNIHLPLLFGKMREESNPMMEKYWKSITYARGNTGRQQEIFTKDFLAGGGTDAVQGVWNTLGSTFQRMTGTGFGGTLGGFAKKASHFAQAGMLVAPETLEYVMGNEKQGNYLASMFGSSANNEGLTQLKSLVSSNWELIKAIGGLTAKIANLFGGAIAQVAPLASKLSTEAMKGGVKASGSMANIINSGGTLSDWGTIAKAANPLTFNPAAYALSLLGKSMGSGSSAQTSSVLPARDKAAEKVLNGTGMLSQLPGGQIQPNANVQVTNNMTFQVTNMDQTAQIEAAVKRSSDQAFAATFGKGLMTFPKVAQ